jgi:hypothetical protein
MRVGDFSVEVVGTDSGVTRETSSGHVLARPGQVYTLRLRNHGPLRAVADVLIDGHSVTGAGLVINAWSTVDLERPVHATERGRFTVVAEGDERVFGPDGGRDNADLGLIEARFRREVPSHERAEPPDAPSIPRPIVTLPSPPAPEPAPPRRPFAPPEWTPPSWELHAARLQEPPARPARAEVRALMAPSITTHEPVTPPAQIPGDVERAAGTGLTGMSNQEFVPVHVGRLETEATVIRLRLVIGTEETLDAPRSLPEAEPEPARPAARP